ncbi:MAG TPA: hypothetical protein VMW75_17135 [Thermoanaerobaculia bacterium]|nr:hypothetical protein [Thermoanaerobaculia bacterium]
MEPTDKPFPFGLRARLSQVVRSDGGVGLAAALLCALAAGAALRLWNLGAQVMSGDEFHAIFAAHDRSVTRLLFFYQEADNCIPLSVIDRMLIDRGVDLTEWILRLPVLIAGFALLALAPVWAFRRLGAGTAVALAWLVAISPGLVFYCRIARSYSPATLFACAAVAAFEVWHRRGGLLPAAIYVASAVAAVWFHLGVAPLALSPFLVAALALTTPAPQGRTRGKALARLLWLGAATAAALAALLAPAHRTLLPFLAGKHGRLEVSPREAVEVGEWIAGIGSRWAGAAVAAAAAAAVGAIFLAGLALLCRRHGWLGGFVLAAVAAQLASVLVLAPVAHQSTIVFARYLVFALPLALVPIAAALGGPWPPRWRAAQPWLAAAAGAGLFACGPFLDGELARTSFAHNELYLRFTEPRPRLDGAGPVAVYDWLARAAPGAVIELPWDPIFMFDRALGLYQAQHGRQVVVAGNLKDPRLAFRNMTSSQPDKLLAAPGRWLIVHRAIVREAARIGGNPWEATRELRRAFRGRALAEAAAYRTRWGPPAYEDDWAIVWDLDRVRQEVRPRFEAIRCRSASGWRLAGN